MQDDDAEQPDPTVVTPPPIDEGPDAPSITGVVADDEAAEVDEDDA